MNQNLKAKIELALANNLSGQMDVHGHLLQLNGIPATIDALCALFSEELEKLRYESITELKPVKWVGKDNEDEQLVKGQTAFELMDQFNDKIAALQAELGKDHVQS